MLIQPITIYNCGCISKEWYVFEFCPMHNAKILITDKDVSFIASSSKESQ